MKYNDYIFDLSKEKLIRDFEGAYKNFDDVYQHQFDIDRSKFKMVIDRISYHGKSCRVLDIGAGYGTFINHLISQNIDAVGVEISPSAIEKGKRLYGTLPLSVGDFTRGLSFSQNIFDIVVCFGVITWILDHIDDALKEIKRVLKKEGLLALSMSFKETNVFFRDIVSSEQDFIRLIGEYFKIEDFFVHYYEIKTNNESGKDLNLQLQSRDLIVFCRNI